MYKFLFFFFFAAIVAFVSAKPGIVAPVAYTAPVVSTYGAVGAVPAVSAYSAYTGYPAVSAYSAYPTAYSAPVVSAYTHGVPLAYSAVKYY